MIFHCFLAKLGEQSFTGRKLSLAEAEGREHEVLPLFKQLLCVPKLQVESRLIIIF